MTKRMPLVGVLLISLLIPCGLRAESIRLDYAPRDTLITGCELYLFGRLIEPVRRNGARGHVVKRTATTVMINDVVFFDLEVQEVEPEYSQEFLERSRAEFRTFERVAKEVRESLSLPAPDLVLVNGKVPDFGKIVTHSAGEDGSHVSVEFGETGFFLRYRDAVMFYPYRELSRLRVSEGKQEAGGDARLDRVYYAVATGLPSGAIVVMGHGYRDTYYDSEEHNGLRQALAMIPGRVRPRNVSGFEEEYDAISINGFRFSAAVVRDFVRAGAKK